MQAKLINVLDVEATCYKNDCFPDGEQKEVIEIGLCMVDLKALTIVSTLSIPIVPQCAAISPFCTELTGWTMAKLRRQGVSFEAACERLSRKYGTKNRLLVTDSAGDVQLIRRQCKRLGVPCPLGSSHQNVATLFKLLTGQRKNIGLDAMLERTGLQFEGVRHRGWCDAKNQARLLIELIKGTSLRDQTSV